MKSQMNYYPVLSCGCFPGMGDQLFALPWNALKLDAVNKRLLLNVETDRLDSAQRFDKNHRLNMSGRAWAQVDNTNSGNRPYAKHLPI